MKIILTGASGFIGSRAQEFLSRSHELYLLESAMVRGELDAERTDKLYAKISDFAPDAIINTAAISDCGYSEAHPAESYCANVVLPEKLAHISQKLGCKLINCSSDQVYNACEGNIPNNETLPLTPNSVYGRHKLEAEHRILDINPDSVSLRLTWMYDMPVYYGGTHRNLLLIVLRAAMYDAPMKFSAQQYRGYTYARQVVENLPLALKLPGGVYNYGSENTLDDYTTMLKWLDILELGYKADKLLQRGINRDANLSMDCGKIRAAGINFDDSVEGLRRCIADYPGLLEK